jgi:NAD(P)-dependent dehydrogenase (short-subunit alcohol dehydrogenase family)
MGWTLRDVPDQTGRTIVVTGANSGLGLETARTLAGRGAHVVLACRSSEKAEAARRGILGSHPRASLEVMPLDLANLSSVRVFGATFTGGHDRLDVLCNNAGVMALPRRETADGFEMQIGTNHLGHFALTGLLLSRLLETQGSRIVTVSSEGHARGMIDFDDLQSEVGYRPAAAYCQSKLANLLFTYELDRRLRAAGTHTNALACHPGIVLTNLYRTRSKLERALLSPRLRRLNSRLVQSTQMGALPILRAATDPNAQGGEFYGPPGRGYVGHPVPVQSSARSHDEHTQRRLWRESELLTGVTYGI